MERAQKIGSKKDPLMVPTVEEWAKMSLQERENAELEIIAALEGEFDLMGETTIHFQNRVSISQVLYLFIRQINVLCNVI